MMPADEHTYTPQWFALYVQVRHERVVDLQLTGKGLESFLPCYRSRRKWADRYKELELPLFPGYVFCHFDGSQRGTVLGTSGVIRIVGYGPDPTPVDPAEVQALQVATRSGLRCEPVPFLEAGQRVLIQSGPLTGVEGLLLEVKAKRKLVLGITLLQRSVSVEVDSSEIRLLETPRKGAAFRKSMFSSICA